MPIMALELLAAMSGIYYLKQSVNPAKNTKYLVVFLWFTVFVETVGCYAPIAYFTEYQYFSFIKETSFESNIWWYNMFIVINFTFFTFYFLAFTRNKLVKNIGITSAVLFFIISICVYVFTDGFLSTVSNFVIISGTLLLLMSVLSFYFEVLRSDLLLQLKHFLPFYISVGVLVFNLCVTPLDILSDYFNVGNGNELFVKLRTHVILYANILLYFSFTLGFLICSKKKKFSS